MEKIIEKEFRRIIEDCIVGKKDLVRKVDKMDMCTYSPSDFPEGVTCRYAQAVYANQKGVHYMCGKNLTCIHTKTKDLNNSSNKVVYGKVE